LALHLTQYPSGIENFLPGASCGPAVIAGYLTGALFGASTTMSTRRHRSSVVFAVTIEQMSIC
jgi:hypothetical protein